MKITALEEHLITPAILDAWRARPEEREDRLVAAHGEGPFGSKLRDLASQRIADMDDQGIDVQVLSVTSPGTQNLTPAQAVPLARQANDAMAQAVTAYPERFEAFATLPTTDPEAAAAELRRTVHDLGFKGALIHGRTGSANLDHAQYEPVWTAAVALRAPIYIHPQTPVAAVRDAYYSGFGANDMAFGGPALGWHYETGVQVLRMMLGGVFDRHPDLQVIIGHWGEAVLFYVDRFMAMQERGWVSLRKPVIDYFRANVFVTGSGDLNHRYLAWTKDLLGVDRIMYSTDYPYIDTSGGRARSFLEQASLTDVEKHAVAHGTWERLTAHLR